MRTFNSKDLAFNLADHEECNYNDAKEIIDSVFGFVRETMKEGDRKNYEYKNVRIFNLGLFAVKKGKVNYYKRKDQKNE